MSEPDRIVLRHSPTIPEHLVDPHYEGLWMDKSRARRLSAVASTIRMRAVANPTGRFEFRSDGAVAEVWEIRLVGER